MPSKYSDIEKSNRILLSLQSIEETINHAIEWNQNISTAEDYYKSSAGMQLLAANCTLISAIGEGVNRINRVFPEFLSSNFPEVPWIDIIGMRNRIVHGYFELDADLIFETISHDIPLLLQTIQSAIYILKQ